VASDGGAADRSGARTTAAIVLAAVGVTALGGGAYFALRGKAEVDDLRGSCAPRCAGADVDAAKTKLVIGDVAFGVSLVALGAAAYLFLTRPKGPSAATSTSTSTSTSTTALPRFDARVRGDGALFELAHSF
jgi:hypothetical protein